MTILLTTSSPLRLFVGVMTYSALPEAKTITDNQPQITAAIKPVLDGEYNYDSTVSDCATHETRLGLTQTIELVLCTISLLYGVRVCRRRGRHSILQKRPRDDGEARR